MTRSWNSCVGWFLLLLLHDYYHNVVWLVVEALPSGAPSCTTGSASVGGSHTSATTIETGGLATIVTVTLNGNEELTESAFATTVPAGMDHALIFTAMNVDQDPIRGFNILLTSSSSSSNLDLLDILSTTDSEMQQINDNCDSDVVVGITHTNPDPKEQFAVTVRIDEPSVTVQVHVTVVVQNSNGISKYYYSNYTLVSAESNDLQEGDTTSPTNEPSTTTTMTYELDTIMNTMLLVQVGGPLITSAELGTVIDLLQQSGVADILADSTKTLTFFAPNDAAFEQLGTVTLEKYRSDRYRYHLKDLLHRHIIPNQTLQATVDMPSGLLALNGDPVTLVNGVYNEVAKLTDPLGAVATNGIFHGLESVATSTFADWSISDWLLEVPDMTLFLELIVAAGLQDMLDLVSNVPRTILVPTFGFMNRTEIQRDAKRLLLPENRNQLVYFIESHIADDCYPMERLATISEITMRSGYALPVRGSTKVGNATILLPDEFVSNGLIHMVNATTVPLFSEQPPQLVNSTTTTTTLSPTTSEGTSKPTNDTDTINGTCDYCSGGVVTRGVALPDGRTCEEWAIDAAVAPSDSDTCILDRLLGAMYCGCPPGDTVLHCDLCGADSTSSIPEDFLEVPLPDLPAYQCRILLVAPAVDGETTCDLLTEKFAFNCGCPMDSESSTCRLCEETAPANLSHPFAGPSYGCLAVDEILQATPSNDCESAKADTAEFAGVNMNEYCCPSIQPSGSCGDFCTDGTSVPVTLLNSVVTSVGITCQQALDVFPYMTANNNSGCDSMTEAQDACCELEATNVTGDPNSTTTSTGNQSCTICDGGVFTAVYVFPSGATCEAVLMDETGQPIVNSEDDCTFSRAAAAGYCGCTFPAGVCNVCEGAVVDDADASSLVGGFSQRIIPGDEGFSCSNVFGIPAIDRAETCEVLQQRFSGHCGCSAPAGTVQDLLDDSLNLKIFKTTLSRLNFNMLLGTPSIQFTVFAPPDIYLVNDTLLQTYSLESWSGHLAALLKRHIVANATLSLEDLWSENAGDHLISMAGEVPVDATLELIGNRSIIVPNLTAQNGVVHEINGPMFAPWMFIKILELLQTPTGEGIKRLLQAMDSFSRLVSSLQESNLADDIAFLGFVQTGTTVISPRDVAFEEYDGAVDNVGDTLLYHILEINNYLELREKGSQVVLSTRHPTADVLMTVDQDGVVRYNDVEVSNEMLAANGVIHAVDSLLTPPGMIETLGYAKNFTDIKIDIAHEFLVASGWDATNLSISVQGAENNRFTLFVPLDEVFDDLPFMDEFRARLVTQEWSRHLNLFLKNILTPSALALGILSSQPETVVSSVGMETIKISNSDALSIGAGQLRLDLNPSCVDGVVYFVGQGMPITFPPIGNDVLSYMKNFPAGDTIFLDLLEGAGSSYLIDDSSWPVTVFAPPDFAWDLQENGQETESILQNHIFDRLWFLDDLSEMDGETINSINGKAWTISYSNGTVMLSSASGMTVGVVDEKILRNGILHYLQGGLLLDEAVEETPTFAPNSPSSPSMENQTLQPVQSPSGLFQNCTACDGSIDQAGSLPDGSACDAWQKEVSQLEANSEQCLLERALGVEYCGCPKSAISESCNPCPGTNLDASKTLPDARGLTCASLGSGALVSVDNSTCEIVAEKYASWCGCPNATEPTCSFCPSEGIQLRPDIVPFSFSFDYMVFGTLANTTCLGVSDYFSVQTNTSCDNAGDRLVGRFPFDFDAWCGCSTSEPPKLCGEFCSTGSKLQEFHVFDSELNFTCKQVSELFEYVADKTVCAEAERVKELCCLPELVVVNTSFVVSNQRGLTASDLASAENGSTLNRAFLDFVENLVAETEGKKRNLRVAPWTRRLLAKLQENSTAIHAVEMVDCPSDVPAGSVCQQVHGRFNLLAQGEEPQIILNRYEAATPAAIEGGKLQQSLDTVHPNFPFRVAGIPVTDDGNKDSGSNNMSWWLILLIVIASVSGCCGILCLLVFAYAKRRTSPEEEREPPKAEASVQLLPKGPAQPQGRQEMEPLYLDESSWTDEDEDVEVLWKQTNEENKGWVSPESRAYVAEEFCCSDEESVEMVDEKAEQNMEQARSMPVEVDDGASDSWANDGEWDDNHSGDDEWEGSKANTDTNGDSGLVRNHCNGDEDREMAESSNDGQPCGTIVHPNDHRVDAPEHEPDEADDDDEEETYDVQEKDFHGGNSFQVADGITGDSPVVAKGDETDNTGNGNVEEGFREDKIGSTHASACAPESAVEEGEAGTVPWMSVSDSVTAHEPSQYEEHEEDCPGDRTTLTTTPEEEHYADAEQYEKFLPENRHEGEGEGEDEDEDWSDDSDQDDGIVQLQGELSDADKLASNNVEDSDNQLYEEQGKSYRESDGAITEEWDDEDIIGQNHAPTILSSSERVGAGV